MVSGLYIGLLSGTSLDAIDGALLSFDKELPKIIGTESYPLPAKLRKRLFRLFESPDNTPIRRKPTLCPSTQATAGPSRMMRN